MLGRSIRALAHSGRSLYWRDSCAWASARTGFICLCVGQQYLGLAGHADTHAHSLCYRAVNVLGISIAVCAERCGFEADVCGDETDRECCKSLSCMDNGAYQSHELPRNCAVRGRRQNSALLLSVEDGWEPKCDFHMLYLMSGDLWLSENPCLAQPDRG